MKRSEQISFIILKKETSLVFRLLICKKNMIKIDCLYRTRISVKSTITLNISVVTFIAISSDTTLL